MFIPEKFEPLQKISSKNYCILKNNFKNKTLIIISHRISCVKDADNIIVLDNGKIIQSGSHNQLLKKKF